MNVCLIGNGISTLILANVLANRDIKVSIYEEVERKKKLITRTLGISKNNYSYLIKEKININKRKNFNNGMGAYNSFKPIPAERVSIV